MFVARLSAAIRLLLLVCGLSAALAPPAARAAKIELDMIADQPVIFVSGEILPDDDKKFEEVAKGADGALVALHSPGGAALAAIGIGRAIRARGFETLVPEDAACISACAIIWLGGAKRLLHTKAVLGFHASFIEEDGAARESGVANALVGAYYNSLGLSDMAVMYLSIAPPDDMLTVDAKVAAMLGIEVEELGAADVVEADGPISVVKNVDLYGYDYRRIDSVSVETCQRGCEREADCAAFTFNHRHSVCFFKSDARIGLHNTGATSGYKRHVRSRIHLSNMEVLEGIDLPGADYRSLSGSFGQCFVECSRDRKCTAFSWVGRNGSCWLKTRAARRAPNTGIISGTKVRGLTAAAE